MRIVDIDRNFVSRTFMNVLDDPSAMSHFRGWQRMNDIAQISDTGPAHFLLVCDGSNSEFSGLLLRVRKRRLLDILGSRFTIGRVTKPWVNKSQDKMANS
jgi:hypothetical protein